MQAKKSIIAILCFSIFGCSYIQPTKNPIKTIHYFFGKEQSQTLFIMLPGMGSRADDFLKYGFIQQMKESGVKADVILVDAYLGYYLKRNLINCLHEDVIIPARQKGYQQIWMLGISIGGFGTLEYTKEHPHTLKGIVLLSPFLGYDKLIDEIRNAGGLLKWSPKVPLTDKNYQEVLWDWLKTYSKADNNLPRLILGYGQEDGFILSNKLLADVLPANQVYVLPGKHDWSTWSKLFGRILNNDFNGSFPD